MFSGEAARSDGNDILFRDAACGLGAIASALDQGLDVTCTRERAPCRLSDMAAIGLGWLLLAVVIFYPALQLLAIAAGVFFLGGKSAVRLVLGRSSALTPYGVRVEQRRPYLAVS